MPREHNTDDGVACWCHPHIEDYEAGQLIIHNDEAGAALGLDARYVAEGQPEPRRIDPALQDDEDWYNDGHGAQIERDTERLLGDD